MEIIIGTKTIVIPKDQEKKLFVEVYDWLIDHKLEFEVIDNEIK